MAIDPGKMTGLAEYETHPPEFFAHAQSYDDAMSWVTARIEARVYDEVVMEDFVVSERTAKASSAGWKRGKELEFIGVVRWSCERAGIPFTTYTPAQAKGFSTDDKLRRMGWWTRGLDHPRDAARHLLLYCVEGRLVDPRLLVG